MAHQLRGLMLHEEFRLRPGVLEQEHESADEEHSNQCEDDVLEYTFHYLEFLLFVSHCVHGFDRHGPVGRGKAGHDDRNQYYQD